MTWGELGAHIVAVFPDIDPNLRVDCLNRAHEAILEERKWSGLQGSTTLRTVDEIQAGSVALTDGSATVTGTGTAFYAGMVGMRFKPTDAMGNVYRITAYASPTEITLDRGYEGTTGTGLGYVIYQDQFSLPVAVKAVQSMTVPGYAPLEQVSLETLEELYAGGFYYGPPACYAALSDPLSTASPVLNEVRIYPAPDQAYDISVVYQSAVYGYTGRNTSTSPLPWISRSALLAKAKQIASEGLSIKAAKDGNALLASRLTQAAAEFRGEYVVEVRKMHATENLRAGPTKMRGPGDSFFRHRRQWGRS